VVVCHFQKVYPTTNQQPHEGLAVLMTAVLTFHYTG
jgi:hypothetical protein